MQADTRKNTQMLRCGAKTGGYTPDALPRCGAQAVGHTLDLQQCILDQRIGDIVPDHHTFRRTLSACSACIGFHLRLNLAFPACPADGY
jgi:hypothetical protein